METNAVRMSPSFTGVVKAFFGVKKQLEPIKKTAFNEAIGNSYAGLKAILDVLDPLLIQHELVMTFGQVNHGETRECVTRIIHVETGEWMENSVFLDVQFKDPQGSGSLTTYGKRYGVSALFSLNTDEDDDGERAMGGKVRKDGSSEAAPVAASEGQIKMINDLIAEKDTKVENLDEIFADKTKASLEIDRLKKLPTPEKAGGKGKGGKKDDELKAPTGRKPSAAQLRYLDQLSKEHGQEIPKEALEDSGLASNEINRLKAIPAKPVSEATVVVAEKPVSTDPSMGKEEAAVKAEAPKEVDPDGEVPEHFSEQAKKAIKLGDQRGWVKSADKAPYLEYLRKCVAEKSITREEATFIRKRFRIPAPEKAAASKK